MLVRYISKVFNNTTFIQFTSKKYFPFWTVFASLDFDGQGQIIVLYMNSCIHINIQGYSRLYNVTVLLSIFVDLGAGHLHADPCFGVILSFPHRLRSLLLLLDERRLQPLQVLQGNLI